MELTAVQGTCITHPFQENHISRNKNCKMSEREHAAEPKNFEPKVPVKLDSPKSDPISLDHLAKCDGMWYPRQ